MSKRGPIECAGLEGRSHSLLGNFGIGPKFTIRCGDCGIDFTARVPLVDEPRVACPHCGRVNVLPLEVSG